MSDLNEKKTFSIHKIKYVIIYKGFRYKPSSVYLMPYWYKYEAIRNDPPTCHNNKHSFDLQFENLNKL